MQQFLKNQPAIWVFAAAFILLLVTAVVADKITASYRDSVALVTHTREVELHVARARSALAQAETEWPKAQEAAGGVSQTLDDHLRDVEAELRQIRTLTADNPARREKLDSLMRSVRELHSSARMGLTASSDAPPLPEPRFQEADEQLKQMSADEAMLLAARVQLSEAEYRRMLVFFRACFAFAALILFWSSLDILRHSVRTSRAERVVRALNVRLQRAHDEEGKRIGRELHDSVGQLFAATRMVLSRIEARAELPADVREQARFAMEAADEGTREVRTISYLLHPPMLEELGFAAAAEWFVKGFSERSGITVNLHLPEGAPKLRPEVSLALFRALQVGLSNVHRHSQSKCAEVSLTQDNAGCLCLEVRDFGAGIAADRLELLQKLPAAVGMGLGGLKERLRQLQGDLEITSNSKGTALLVRLPAE